MSDDSGFVEATWVGPDGYSLNNTGLIPGETVVLVPEGEAIASDNWQPVKASKTEKKGS